MCNDGETVYGVGRDMVRCMMLEEKEDHGVNVCQPTYADCSQCSSNIAYLSQQASREYAERWGWAKSQRTAIRDRIVQELLNRLQAQMQFWISRFGYCFLSVVAIIQSHAVSLLVARTVELQINYFFPPHNVVGRGVLSKITCCTTTTTTTTNVSLLLKIVQMPVPNLARDKCRIARQYYHIYDDTTVPRNLHI